MASKIVLFITDISSTGQGIAKHNGKVYFVANAYPLQTVEAVILQEKNRYSICNMLTLIDDRATERPYLCPHTHCGGCALRAIPYEEQCRYKEASITNAFTKIAKQAITLNTFHAMDEPRAYRLKAEFHYGYTREGTIDIGFYEVHSHTIVPITHCAVVPQAMLHLVAIARSQLHKSSAPVYHNGSGFWRHLIIRRSVSHNQYMVHCITTPQTLFYNQVQTLFDACKEAFPSCICVHSVRKSKTLLAQAEYTLTPYEGIAEICTIANTTRTITYGANCFFQNNYTMMHSLYNEIAKHCNTHHSYLDICTGVGSIALTCFTNAKEIHGIDSIGESISYAKYNAHINGIPAHFTPMDMKQLSAKDINGIERICVDPPRGGLHSSVIHALTTNQVEHILYVSCNPTTMARDCALLQDSYSIVYSAAFDMFPQTVHIESMVLMSRHK